MTAADAHKNAKGKDAKAAALAAKEAAKAKMDEAKKANPTDITISSLKTKLKTAEKLVDKPWRKM